MDAERLRFCALREGLPSHTHVNLMKCLTTGWMSVRQKTDVARSDCLCTFMASLCTGLGLRESWVQAQQTGFAHNHCLCTFMDSLCTLKGSEG